MPTNNQILSDLSKILADFNGREYSGTIDANTLFMGDLGFSSIDVVILGEKLESHYQTEISFGDFVSELSRKNVLDVPVGDLVNYLEKVL